MLFHVNNCINEKSEKLVERQETNTSLLCERQYVIVSGIDSY